MLIEEIEPNIFIILGATGDLTKRKLFPAIYELLINEKMKGKITILGVAHGNLTDEDMRISAMQMLESHGQRIDKKSFFDWCNCNLFYQSIGKETDEDYRKLAERIIELEKKNALPGNRVFYMALPPLAFIPTVYGLAKAGLNHSSGWTRLVFEKPFGRDLQSARELNQKIHQHFDESQIYRIDHYLGKETVRNLLVFRFSNAFFEHLWNREHIDIVEITVAEKIGVEHRAKYYDQAGALRDMIQNHLTQLLTLITMGEITAFKPEIVHYEKTKILKQITSLKSEDAMFGQYTDGTIEGKEVPGYREEPGIPKDSQTETFVALKLQISNWRWKGVQFYLRTGKRMTKKLTQIVIKYHCAPVSVFVPSNSALECPLEPNSLTILIQPDEGFDLHFQVKMLGEPIKLSSQRLHFRYAEVFGPIPDAYETLLLDILKGDQTLFVTSEWTEASWRIYDDLLSQKHEVYQYSAGSWGPQQADKIFSKPSDKWQNL